MTIKYVMDFYEWFALQDKDLYIFAYSQAIKDYDAYQEGLFRANEGIDNV